MKSINPKNEELIREYEELTDSELKERIGNSGSAFREWSKRPFGERSDLFRNLAKLLRNQGDDLAVLMADEMGKPIREGKSEIEKCAWVCEYYAERAETMLQDHAVASDASKSFVAYRPLGTVLAIMPWNFPFWQVFRFAAPTLMAGNTGLLKHAENVPGCALKIEELFLEAGFPKAVFQTLLVDKKRINSAYSNPLVHALTLTGSTGAGRAVAEEAGKNLKKVVLELGGSDPYVILGDVDPIEAAKLCVKSRMINSGQSCIAAKRFIVQSEIREAFEAAVVEEMKKAKVGDPREEDTDVGPLARKDLRDGLHRQVKESVKAGAKCLMGGKPGEGSGAFYMPTVLTNVDKGMPAFDEELFGPVASIIEASSEADAIEKANDSVFGLGAAVFSKDVERATDLAKNHLEAGCCFVNTFVKSDPRLPFGGIKESGYGRELGEFGIKEFVNVKTVYVK